MAAPNNIVFATSDLADDVSVLDVLDHVLNAGVVIRGNLIISLAGVDLIYVGLDVLLTSVETALRHMKSVNAALPEHTIPRKLE
jgi:hypothetical protein